MIGARPLAELSPRAKKRSCRGATNNDLLCLSGVVIE